MPAFSTRKSILPRLSSTDRLANLLRSDDRADLGVGHEPTWSEDPTDTADLTHHVGRRDRLIELKPAALNLGDQLVTADEVGTRILRSLGGLALGEHHHADILAGTVGRAHRATDHLVGVTSGRHRARTATSTPSSNLAVALAFTVSTAASTSRRS